MANRQQRKQPPPKRMTTRERRVRVQQDSAAIQGTTLTKRQQRAQTRKLAQQPRSDALAAMSDAHLSPPPDKLKAAAPVVTTIRSGAAGRDWLPPAAHYHLPEDEDKRRAERERAAGQKLEKLIADLEQKFKKSNRTSRKKESPHGKAKS